MNDHSLIILNKYFVIIMCTYIFIYKFAEKEAKACHGKDIFERMNYLYQVRNTFKIIIKAQTFFSFFFFYNSLL